MAMFGLCLGQDWLNCTFWLARALKFVRLSQFGLQNISLGFPNCLTMPSSCLENLGAMLGLSLLRG